MADNKESLDNDGLPINPETKEDPQPTQRQETLITPDATQATQAKDPADSTENSTPANKNLLSLNPINLENENWADAKESSVFSTNDDSQEYQQREKGIALNLLNRLQVKVNTLEELYEEITKLNPKDISINEVNCYESLIQEERKEFLELQTPLMVNVNNDHDYFKEQGYQRAARTRRSALLGISRLRTRLTPPPDPAGAITGASTSHHLSRLSLPTFSGDFTSWKEFADLFQSLVGRLHIPPVGKLERLCYNCLGTHNVKTCGSKKFCLRCDGKHHTLICEKGKEGSTNPPADSSESKQTPRAVVNYERKPTTEDSTNYSINGQDNAAVYQQTAIQTQPIVLLATAKARAYSTRGYIITARLLIDQGSELTFISERLVKQLKLQRKASTINLTGIGNTNSGTTKGVVSVQLASIHEPYERVDLRAHILGRLTARLPSFSSSSTNIGSLRQLQLADEDFMRPGAIDILIGADNYGQITKHQSLAPDKSQLVGQLTVFGWTLCGPINCTNCSTRKTLTAVRISSNEQLLQLLQKFWLQEELPTTNRSVTEESSPDDQECERHFLTKHSRDSTGRYIIRLPLRTSPSELGESRSTALRQLHSVSRRLNADPSYKQLYTDFINEYEALHHMQQAPETSEPPSAYYLPHHGVLRAESTTTRLRVVFNGSSKTTSGLSLNDILYTGGKLQVDAMEVTTWMRIHKYVFGTDIVKMFRQINVHKDDWDLQRILWFKENHQIVSYQLTTVTYGLSCSPWLSLRVLQQLVNDGGHRFPKAVPTITKGVT